jgi:hypothetical protein
VPFGAAARDSKRCINSHNNAMRRQISHLKGRPVACRAGLSPFLRFELLHEYSEMRGDGSGEGVVLILEALPNC